MRGTTECRSPLGATAAGSGGNASSAVVAGSSSARQGRRSRGGGHRRVDAWVSLAEAISPVSVSPPAGSVAPTHRAPVPPQARHGVRGGAGSADEPRRCRSPWPWHSVQSRRWAWSREAMASARGSWGMRVDLGQERTIPPRAREPGRGALRLARPPAARIPGITIAPSGTGRNRRGRSRSRNRRCEGGKNPVALDTIPEPLPRVPR